MKMKSLKAQFIGAIAMVLVAAVAMGSSTYAWFAMNTQVSATGMQVKAVAEEGILIINEQDADSTANWKKTTQASYSSIVNLAPTSTNDASAWYHAESDDQDDAKSGQAAAAYTTLSSDANWKRDEGDGKTGVYYIDSSTDGTKDSVEKAYVLLNKFYIKSSGNAITLASGQPYEHFYVNKVEVTGASGSAALDASLRVLVKIGSESFIYAPVASAVTSYTVAGTTATTATAVPATGIVNTPTNLGSIPDISATKASATEVDVYVYFEGEDAGLKSSNLVAEMDTLNISLTFGVTTVA